jgi:tetratricopeptide (TPR) repeat protein/transcriptional regulator with XRE-family HTH domain
MDPADRGPSLGELVRAERIARGLTLEELSARAGVGLRTLSDLERNRVARPHRRTVEALTETLGLPSRERDGIRAGPAQLPARSAAFGGRADAVAALLTLAEEAAAGTASPIGTVVGMPGVGKTALAVHCAHRLADDYPDGQLYLNLQGFAGQVSAVTPGQALRYLLDAFAVPPREIPVGVEAQAALFRSVVARRRVLILLDNARDAAQVRPLLPGSAGCLTLVTSRDALTELVAVEGARSLTLGPLDGRDSHDVLASRLGAERLAADPAPVAQLIDVCAGLPLALAIVAARAAMRPTFPLSTTARELTSRSGGLQALDRLGRSIGPVTIFSWSYDVLTAPAARLFRLLGLFRGPSIGIAAAACLGGLDEAAAGPLLDELTQAHLVIEIAPGRFALHDLVREYAADLTASAETGEQRRAALSRLFGDYFRDRATEAADLVAYGRSSSTGSAARHFTGRDDASDWLATERDALVAVPTLARDEQLFEMAVQIPCAIDTYLDMSGHREDRVAVLRLAAEVARQTGDIRAWARCERRLGLAEHELGRHDTARRRLEEAIRLAERGGDPADQAEAHRFLAHLLSVTGHTDKALPYAQRTVELYRGLDSRGLANALNLLGYLHAELGNHPLARRYCGEALALTGPGPEFTRTRAAVLDSLGFIEHRLADLRSAAAHYREAVRLRGETGDRLRRATSLLRLATVAADAGDETEALGARSEALEILHELRHPDAEHVRELLARANLRQCRVRAGNEQSGD